MNVKYNPWMAKVAVFFLPLMLYSFFVFFIGKERYPDIILITLDSLRADHLGCYGYPRETSPNIDKLAKEGVLFNNCFSVSTRTNTVFPSFLTGLYLINYTTDRYCYENVLDKKFRTLAEYLKQRGYFSVALVENLNLSTGTGFERGFDIYEVLDKDTRRTTDKVISILKKYKNRNRIFIWVHYLDPHLPYSAPDEFIKPFENDLLSKQNDKELKLNPNFKEAPCESSGYIPRSAFRTGKYFLNYYIAAYDSAISYADYNVGRLLENVKDDTLIVLSADHGECFGEGNEYCTHGGGNLNDAQLHVPLIIKDKRCFRNGKIVKTAVSVVDIVPTVLNEISPKIYFLSGDKFDGLALNKLLDKKKTTRSYIYAYSEDNARIIEADSNISYSVEEEQKRYVSEKYCSSDYCATVRQLKEQLKGWLRNYPVCSSLSPRRKEDVIQDTIDRLKSLGYLN